ncbi:hypothetical protein GCM10009555_005710 [Acrocarpospora macrocephala]|uniref:Flavin reductase like domain-containing protein n=1 Tax=Acrocarpospora macrocephala TaxID=150177 RepID=A0A5M3X0W2_9ACTN|nr:flavin reductase family protein [Acrocarpospora macrocephala]GES14764.1 hypothetical protein Amac_083610 [Acrocarpospora macrocephala]
MKVVVELAAERITIAEPEDFHSLSVTAVGDGDARDLLQRVLTGEGAGELRDGHVWLSVGWLARRLGFPADPGFDAMIDYARSRGWFSDSPEQVRAHVEWETGHAVVRTLPNRGRTVSSQEYRHVLGHFVTGVTVVTAMSGGQPIGFTCQSMSALSLDPPLILICPGKGSTTWPRIAAAGTFAVNLLSAEQGSICSAFARSGSDKFDGVAWNPGDLTGAPVLDDVLGWLECEIQDIHEGGDHWIVTARVLDLEAHQRNPLTFFRGRLNEAHAYTG